MRFAVVENFPTCASRYWDVTIVGNTGAEANVHGYRNPKFVSQ